MNKTIIKSINKLFFLEQWQIGTANITIENLINDGNLPKINWWSHSSGSVFNADPFFLGKRVIFERLNRWRGRGEIWTASLDGTDIQPYIIKSSHLSYPSNVTINNKHYLTVESSESGSFTIYQHIKGSDDKIITQINEPIIDGTLLFHENKYWIFGTLHPESNQALHIWFSDKIEGPWTSHPSNPVKSDISASRPAGNIISTDKGLIRPAQDCTKGYGSALAFARIEKISEIDYEEKIISRIYPNDQDYSLGIHTINYQDDIILVDGKKLEFNPLAWLFKLRNKLLGLRTG